MKKRKKEVKGKPEPLNDGTFLPLESAGEEVPLAMIPFASIVNRFNGS